MAQNYNDTIHKMQTPFEMRAGLPKKEPKMLEDWEQNHVYEQMIKNNEGKPQYILHDGPPYANGNIHMGTALNKIIKDIIIRYKNMSGFQAPYVPGYDTHGLPIELKALSSLGDKKAGVSKLELRQICKEFATEHIGVMNEQFKRLGVQGDFENPYLTLRPEFEARQVEIFGEMAKKGYIYKGMKAVYWCPEDRTALAEAEIEYAEDECDSIYVRFKLTDDPNGVLAKHNIPLDKAWIVIWTTTTWTLPANVATCLNPNLEYAFVKIGDAYHIMARELVESTMKGTRSCQRLFSAVSSSSCSISIRSLTARVWSFWATTSRWKAARAASTPLPAMVLRTLRSASITIRRFPLSFPWTRRAA